MLIEPAGACASVAFALALGGGVGVGVFAGVGVVEGVGLGTAVAVGIVVGGIVVWHTRNAQRRRAIWTIGLFALFVAGKGVSRLSAEALFTAVRGRPVQHVEAVWGSVARWNLYSRMPTSLERWEVDFVTRTVRRQIEVTLVDQDPGAARLARASLEWETVRNFRRSHDFVFSSVTESATGASRVMWSDLRYCGAGTVTSFQCSVRVGGELLPNASPPRLIVEIGHFVQTR